MVCSFQDVPIVTGDNFLQLHALDEPMRFGTRIDQYQAHRSNEGLVTLCANEQLSTNGTPSKGGTRDYVAIAHSSMFLHNDFVCNRSLFTFQHGKDIVSTV